MDFHFHLLQHQSFTFSAYGPADSKNSSLWHKRDERWDRNWKEHCRKITSSGSTIVGKKLMVVAADTVKRVSLQLGGNASCIVFDDANVEVVIKGSLTTTFH